MDAGNRSVGPHVGWIRQQLGAGDQPDPGGIEVLERPTDRVGLGHPRDDHDRESSYQKC